VADIIGHGVAAVLFLGLAIWYRADKELGPVFGMGAFIFILLTAACVLSKGKW
jgi:hypothetical protein